MHVAPGEAILEVGCGPGTDLFDLAGFKGQDLDVRSFDPVQVFVHYSLAELFLGSHLTRLQTTGILSPDSARRWWDYLRQADERGTLMISFTAFVIVGSKN